MNWRISHRPIFEIPGRKEFPTLTRPPKLAYRWDTVFRGASRYMRTNHITGQWGMAALYLTRDACGPSSTPEVNDHGRIKNLSDRGRSFLVLAIRGVALQHEHDIWQVLEEEARRQNGSKNGTSTAERTQKPPSSQMAIQDMTRRLRIRDKTEQHHGGRITFFAATSARTRCHAGPSRNNRFPYTRLNSVGRRAAGIRRSVRADAEESVQHKSQCWWRVSRVDALTEANTGALVPPTVSTEQNTDISAQLAYNKCLAEEQARLNNISKRHRTSPWDTSGNQHDPQISAPQQ